MDIIIEIIFERVIIRLFGIYTRYLIFYLFGKKRSLESLKGKNKNLQEEHSQDFWNVIIGLIAFGLVSFLIAYLTFM